MRDATKVLTGEVREVAGDGSFEAVIATIGSIDSDGDVVMAGALPPGPIPILPAHCAACVPLGKAWIREEGDEVVASGLFNLEIADAADWYAAIRYDFANPPTKQEWSWSFHVVDAEPGAIDGRKVRLLRAVDLIEVSPVLRGASVGTRTTCAGTSCHQGKVAKADGHCCHECEQEHREKVAAYRRELEADYWHRKAAEKRRRARIDQEIAAEYGWVRAWAEPATPPLRRIVDQVAAKYRIGGLTVTTKPGAFVYREVEPGRKYNLWVKRACRGVCFPNGARPLMGINAQISFTAESLLWTLGHELAHAAGHREEAPCDAFGERVVAEMVGNSL